MGSCFGYIPPPDVRLALSSSDQAKVAMPPGELERTVNALIEQIFLNDMRVTEDELFWRNKKVCLSGFLWVYSGLFGGLLGLTRFIWGLFWVHLRNKKVLGFCLFGLFGGPLGLTRLVWICLGLSVEQRVFWFIWVFSGDRWV